MAYEFTVKINKVDKIECAMEEILNEFRNTELLSNVIKKDGKIILPSEGDWDRWLELQELDGQIYYWTTQRGNELKIINNAIANALHRLQIYFTIKEE